MLGSTNQTSPTACGPWVGVGVMTTLVGVGVTGVGVGVTTVPTVTLMLLPTGVPIVFVVSSLRAVTLLAMVVEPAPFATQATESSCRLAPGPLPLTSKLLM